MTLAELRTDYGRHGLSEADAGDDPLELFRRWFDQATAAGQHEPNAMTLASCTPDGKPSARVVLLKVADERGLTFFTNYLSRKARELTNNPHAALVFFWPTCERQVRVEGTIGFVSEAESDEYFATRPVNSRLGAWASEQSEVIPSRAVLEDQHRELTARFGDNVPRPPHWGGFRVVPTVWEFWQGRPSRLHDRIRFRKIAGGWARERLSP
jgi:pyridoxamine 5'-phosphate oxidase